MTNNQPHENRARRETKANIQAWLATQIADLLSKDVSTLDIRAPFTDFGLSSRDAVLLSGDLEEWLNRRLSPTLLYEYPSIETLAMYLSGESSDIKTSPAPQTDPALIRSSSDMPTVSPLTADQLAQLSDEEAERLLIEKLNKIDRGA